MEHERGSALTLPDRRTLAFAELADRTGPPVLVLDGPGSRGLARAAAATGAADGLRLIAPDRPGFGASTSVARIDHAAFAADLVALLDHLGVDATGVVAQSGGTPFALALAASRPDRVRRLSLLGGFAPVQRSSDLDGVAPSAKSGFRLARRAPWLLRVILRRMAAGARKDPGEAARKVVRDAPAADRAALGDPALWAIHERSTAEVLSRPDALVGEMRALVGPWDLDLGTIRAPVCLWTGDRDTTHPPAMARRLAARLPDAEARVVPGAMTFGLVPVYAEALRFAADYSPAPTNT